ncbi:MAG: amino acid ABC transporter substrate-binding protein, partial [SAR324 cluster bacterium]|nr:amino acid ABC transporter substrate-binding protein [SAR324 cluster bacterium]
AEELGLTSTNISSFSDSDNYQIRKIIGADGDFGESMGLSQNFMYEIINQVGNYGEIYENNIGVNSPLGLERNLNSLWNNGGLLY